MKSYKMGEVVFGNWKIVKLIGKGSFGAVYEIERIDFGVTYKAALKVISVPQDFSEIKAAQEEGMNYNEVKRYFYTVVEEIVNEFALMSKLKGTANVVSYEDHQVVPHEGGIGWDILIRMELLTPLLTYAYANPFTRRDIMQLGISMCKALELCQKYNIIHRDIKPENIFVSANGDFKLGDFGIARTVEKTTSGLSKKGTFSYMAPEVYRGKEYGFSVDIYSLGVVLYRLLNKNRIPFMPEAPKAITFNDREKALAMRMSGNAIENPFYSEGRLPEIVMKACAFDPKERYESPLQMREELEAIIYDKRDAQIIYPTGDEVSVVENQYISKMQSKNKNLIEDDGETEIIFNTSKMEDLRRKEDVFEAETQILLQEQEKVNFKNKGDISSKQKVKGKGAIIAGAVVLVVVIGVGIVLYQNNQAKEQELETAQAVMLQQEEYIALLAEANSLASINPAEAAGLFLEAIEIQPDNPDATVGYAYTVYLMEDYAGCIDYIENDLALGKAYDISYQSQLAEILGAAYFEQQDYAAAASFFRLSTAGGDISVSAMRDYAVSLGRLGDIDAADEILQQMFDAGATQIETTYVQAEVDYAKAEYVSAESGFLEVWETTDDAALQVRSLRSLAEVYRDCAALERLGNSPIADAATKEAELLANGIVELGLYGDSTLWEMLALAYYEAYRMNPNVDDSWLQKAADAFQEVIDLGIQKEYLYSNLYSIYYDMGDYTMAEQALVDYEVIFGNSYIPHALRAMMLVSQENQKAQDNRNYTAAYQEYEVAKSMLTSNADQTYFQQVESVINSLIANDWL